MRGIALDGVTRAQILDERDQQQFDRWIARAVTCTTLAEVLADD